MMDGGHDDQGGNVEKVGQLPPPGVEPRFPFFRSPKAATWHPGGIFANSGRARAYTHVLARVYSTRARVIPCQICMKILDPFKNVIFVSYHHN